MRAALPIAVAAAAALILLGPAAGVPVAPPTGRTDAASAWPGARRGSMPGGPAFTPAMFLDPSTAIGTAPGRLLLRTGDGPPRELRRVPPADNPEFTAFAADQTRIVWAESSDRDPKVRLWTAERHGGPARMLTADAGNAVFSGNGYDLVIAEGRVHWAAAPGRADQVTEIRSVPLSGGRVTVRTEKGQWAMSAWPWLADESGGRLRDLATGREVRVAAGGYEQATCQPVWCRVTATARDGPGRIDIMHPDGSGRRRVAGGTVQSAVFDVAVLDRFEILAEPGPTTDLTGTAGLAVYDIATGRTVEVAPEVDGAFTRGGMLWWSVTRGDDLTWHTLDLRTA